MTLKTSLLHSFNHPKYEYLLLSLVVLIAFAAICASYDSYNILLDISYAFVLIMGPLYSSDSVKGFIFHATLGLIILLEFILNFNEGLAGILHSLLTLIFFFGLFTKIIRNVLKEHTVNINTIYASICGYLVLGIAAASTFFIIDRQVVNAYSHSEELIYFDFIYYSFVTLTSLGYGDIVPTAPLSQFSSIIFCISGQLYLTVILALIVGKFVSNHKLT